MEGLIPSAVRTALAAAAGVLLGTAAHAADDELAAGEQLYIAQCKICHGSVTPTEGKQADQRPIVLAMQQIGEPTLSDVGGLTAKGAGLGQLAFAPPFGPNLRGVYGREAGTAKGYEYSKSFLSALKGMVWNDAALDVWITNPQTWVPGVYMFYKQPDAEIRRKIILYLKANP